MLWAWTPVLPLRMAGACPLVLKKSFQIRLYAQACWANLKSPPENQLACLLSCHVHAKLSYMHTTRLSHICQTWLHAHNTCFQACPGMSGFKVFINMMLSKFSTSSCVFFQLSALYVYFLISPNNAIFQPILVLTQRLWLGVTPLSHTRVMRKWRLGLFWQITNPH